MAPLRKTHTPCDRVSRDVCEPRRRVPWVGCGPRSQLFHGPALAAKATYTGARIGRSRRSTSALDVSTRRCGHIVMATFPRMAPSSRRRTA